jgi:hypothetical protein
MRGHAYDARPERLRPVDVSSATHCGDAYLPYDCLTAGVALGIEIRAYAKPDRADRPIVHPPLMNC